MPGRAVIETTVIGEARKTGSFTDGAKKAIYIPDRNSGDGLGLLELKRGGKGALKGLSKWL